MTHRTLRANGCKRRLLQMGQAVPTGTSGIGPERKAARTAQRKDWRNRLVADLARPEHLWWDEDQREEVETVVWGQSSEGMVWRPLARSGIRRTDSQRYVISSKRVRKHNAVGTATRERVKEITAPSSDNLINTERRGGQIPVITY